jgi:hypothetical protein
VLTVADIDGNILVEYIVLIIFAGFVFKSYVRVIGVVPTNPVGWA